MIKISLIQFAPLPNIEDNIEKIGKVINNIDSPDFIVFPEGAFSGYNEKVLNDIDNYAEQIPGKISKKLQQIAEQKRSYVISGIFEKFNDKFHNSIIMVEPSGNIQKRSKTHIAPWVSEYKFFSSGNNLDFFKTKFGPISTAICSELRSPVLLPIQNDMALNEIKEEIFLIFHINAWGKYPAKANNDELNKTFEDRKKLLAARAVENRACIFSVNFSGRTYGYSMVVNQWGETIAELKEEESIINVEIDLNKLKTTRKKFLPLNDSRILKDYRKLLKIP